jgi:hypothetical protein
MRRTVFLAAVLFAGCSGGARTSSLSLSARNSAATGQSTSTASATVVLTRIRVALEKIELRSRTDDERTEIAVGPILLDLKAADIADGKVHKVLDSTIPAGTFDKIELEIEPLERPIDDPAGDDLAKQHASAIIEGTFGDKSFAFVTALRAELEFEGNFVVTDTSSNITFDVDTSSWFVKDGVALDPTDPANRAAIEDNLRRSINAFQDDDELGHENHDVDDDNGDDHGGDRDGGNSGPGGGGDDGGTGGGDDGPGHH